MSSTFSTVTPLLLQHVRDDIESIFFNPDKTITPLIASMETRADNDGAGSAYKVRFLYSKGASVSQSFATAQGISQGSTGGHSAKGNSWTLNSYTTDATAQWSRDTIKASEGNPDDMFDVLTTETDAKIAKIRQRIAIFGWESGYGRIGTMTAVGSSTITLPTSVLNRIEDGDFLVASSSATGALRGGGTVYVTGRNEDTGVVTLSADVSGGSYTWGSTDTVFLAGDHTDSVITCPVGMRGWVPTTEPSGAFMGVTRTGIPELCGTRKSYSGKDHSTALILGSIKQMQRAVKTTHAMLSAEDYGVLTCDKESIKTVATTLGKYQIGFDAFPLTTPTGTINVVPDIYMEQGAYWMGPFGDKKLAPFLIHNDELVNIDEIDGRATSRLYNSTDQEMRLYFRGAMGMVSPGSFHCGTGLATA